MKTGKDTTQGWWRDRGIVERSLKRRLPRDRSSSALRRMLARAHVRPVNIHLLTDQEIVRMLGRLTTASRIQLPADRWWAEDRHRVGADGDGTSTDTAKANGTGGKEVKSSAEPAAEQRHRPRRPAGDSADRPFPPASQQPPEPKNWIEFQLLDDETEAPIANVPFRLSLPDGSVAEHSSDGNGLIRLTDLPPGFCNIQAILDQGALEVVRTA